jgi:hypothetical protein
VIALVSALNSASTLMDCPGLQCLEHRARQRYHIRHVGQHARLQEGRLNESPLPQPELALAGGEAVAEHRHEGTRAEVLDVVLGVGDQHLLDELGIAGEEQLPVHHAEACQRAVGASEI